VKILDRLLLRGREIPVWRAERRLRTLRTAIAYVLVVAVPVVASDLWAWPVARSRALGILLDRQTAMAALSAAAYGQGVKEVVDLEIRLLTHPADPQAALRKKDDLEAIRLILASRQEAAVANLRAASGARATLPRTLRGGAVWRDPLTGEAFPVSATVDGMARTLVEHRLSSQAQQDWLSVVGQASRPGAQPLPDEAAILSLNSELSTK
jgi:hypothetical protein